MNAWLTVWGLLPVLLIGAITTVQVTAGGFVVAVLIGLALRSCKVSARVCCALRSRSMSTCSAPFPC